jgi:hypothetical protein
MKDDLSDSTTTLRIQLVSHLKGGQAFSPINKVIDEMPYDLIGIVPDGLPYSFYQQFYHIWYAQNDIIEYCQNDDYEAPDWPNDYWPDETASTDQTEWKNLIHKYFDERDQFCDYLMDSSNDLFKPFPQNENHNLLRQAELIIEHNAYHIGQLYVIYRLLT